MSGCLRRGWFAIPLRGSKHLLGFFLLLVPLVVWAQTGGLPALTMTPAPGGGQTWTLSIQTLLTLTALTFIPAVVLMMTGFTRIIIVLSLLRHALGTQTSPPNQVLIGLSLFLTFFIMSPVLDRAYTEAYLPLTESRISFTEAVDRGAAPFRSFMLKQTREADIGLFAKLANAPRLESANDVPMRILIPAFVTATTGLLNRMDSTALPLRAAIVTSFSTSASARARCWPGGYRTH